MQSVVIVLLGLCALALAVPPHKALNRDLDEHWGHFKRVHNKQYHLLGEEFNRRLTWEKNVKIINDHNLLADLGHVTFRLGLNQFADLTTKEFAQRFNGYKGAGKSQADTIFKATGIQVDDEVDWRTKGYVTPVKDQGQCGSCWAFSSTGSIEGQNFKKTGKLISLSEQNLVDCSTPEGNAGCGGGWMDQAFAYVVKQGGIDTESSYPYTAQDGQCKFNTNAIGAVLTGHVDVATNEDALKEATATIGPISVAIDAAHSSFQLYKSGVYVEQSCQLNAPDHAVLVVGYGTEDGKDYWLVKNSWAATWGDQGYIKMMRNFHNMCGIANYATYPTL